MKILVSGFEPFASDTVNPTQILIEDLEQLAPQNANVRGVVLPVIFAEAYPKLADAIAEFQPDIIVSLGLAAGRANVELERVAINCLDSDIPDNSGYQPRDEKVDEGGEPAFFSTLPIREIFEELKANDVPAKISNTAGTYVCNSLLYRTLEATKGTHVKAGFVHFPYLPAQAMKKSPQPPHMNYEVMKRGLKTILHYLAQ